MHSAERVSRRVRLRRLSAWLLGLLIFVAYVMLPEPDAGSDAMLSDDDAFSAPDGSAPLVVSNRGASGIDGTVATAAGVARGLGAPVTLLIGDLALLHDLNALALLRDPAQPPVTVVAVNNDGGGIFHFLPIAEHEAVFEPYFGTPHGLGFEHAARMFGLRYHRPETLADLADVLSAGGTAAGSSLVEVRTDRAENRAVHDDLLRQAAAAVEAPLTSSAPLER